MPIENTAADPANITPDSVTNTTANEPTNEPQQAAGTTDETAKRLEFLEREFKEVVKQRDELKRKTREIEEATEKAKLETLQKAGKFEELNNELSAKLAKIEAEKNELLTIAEKYTIFTQQVKQDLLNKLPEAKRKFVEDFELDKLQEYVALEEAAAPKVGTGDTGRPGRGGIDLSKVTFDDFLTMTPEQKEAFAAKSPAKYQEFLKQKNNKRRF